MRSVLCILFLACSTLIYAQQQQNCEQLAIQYMGITQSENKKQLVFEVSNMLYSGNLYNYPGLVLVNEAGDTIAREKITYYGIGMNFQTHFLDLLTEISFPFEGELLLYGSYYKTQFCQFPIEIPSTELITSNSIEAPGIIATTNIAEDHILIDLSSLNINAAALEYFINVTNESGLVVYETSTELSYQAIPTKTVGGKGYYYISIWDNTQRTLLPVQVVWLP